MLNNNRFQDQLLQDQHFGYYPIQGVAGQDIMLTAAFGGTYAYNYNTWTPNRIDSSKSAD